MNHIIIGVDTHKASHIAVAIDANGARLGSTDNPHDPRRVPRRLKHWASRLRTRSKHLASRAPAASAQVCHEMLMARGHRVLDVMRPNRQLRYLHGKSDSLDAESAARSVLSGQATAPAKTQTGSSEMIRHLKIARDSAVKCEVSSDDHIENSYRQRARRVAR